MKDSEAELIARLRQLEGVIRRGKQVLVEVGNALTVIRDNPFFWEPYATFEEYCQERFRIRERASAPIQNDSRRSSGRNAATAYHEAGHAVARVCLGLGVRYVTIVPDEDSDGHVRGERETLRTALAIEFGYKWDNSRFRAEKHVMSLLAGEVAQRRYNSRSVRWQHVQGDRNQSLDILLKYNPHEEEPDMTHHYKMLRKWTVSLIEQHWHLVEAVAKALLEHKTLSGSQVRAVIHAASDLA